MGRRVCGYLEPSGRHTSIHICCCRLSALDGVPAVVAIMLVATNVENVDAQNSANKPENAANEGKGYHRPPLLTSTELIYAVPIEDPPAAPNVVNPLLGNSEDSEITETHDEVKRVVQESPGERNQPDYAEDDGGNANGNGEGQTAFGAD